MKPIFLLLALCGCPGAVFAQSTNGLLLTTFTNPVPAYEAFFGISLAALGNEKVIIAAGGAGKVYLFSTGGVLVTSFTNPNPFGGAFGSSLAAVGTDRVVIGDYDAFIGGVAQVGSVYLFGTNGSLLTTFTNPHPATAGAFGWSVAAVGNDRVVIGALSDNTGASYSGAAYLFSTNGALLTAFTNPTPAVFDQFGAAVAAVGNDRVLISAPEDNTGATRAGSAYLFRTNGALLATFNHPDRVALGNFGAAVASVGHDRLLIGAIDYGGNAGGGAAYLLSTNGNLLGTFRKPAPAVGDNFGSYLTAVGQNRVLIGAYLFSTNGALLTTFTNPAPASGVWSAVPVAAMGSDSVFIGDFRNDTGTTDSGAAYWFALPYPPLSIARNAATVSIQWITAEAGLALQQADVLSPTAIWSNATNAVAITGRTNVVQQSLTNGTTNRFYRLRRP